MYADVRCLFDECGNLRPIKALTEAEASLIAGYEVIIKNAAAGDGHQDTVHKVKLKDQARFVEMAAKHFKLLTEVVQFEVSEKEMAELDAGRVANAEARRMREAARAKR